MKVIIVSSTGLVGRGVLLECIDSPLVSEILIINRRASNFTNPKVIKELVHSDFSSFESISSELKGYNLCIYCMGVSASSVDKEQYKHIMYDMAKALADTLYDVNPQTVLSFVSGAGSNSSEKGRAMWANVKGMAENYILGKGFKDAYAFRPGLILPEKGIKSKTKLYNIVYGLMKPFYPLLKCIKSTTTTTMLGKALIKIAIHPQENKHLDGKDINRIAKL